MAKNIFFVALFIFGAVAGFIWISTSGSPQDLLLRILVWLFYTFLITRSFNNG